MNKDIKKAELLGIEPKEISNEADNEIKMELIFSEIAPYSPKELLKVTIAVTEWLEFLENCFIQFSNPDHIVKTPSLAVEHQKSQICIVGDDKYYFPVPKDKWKRFIEEQVEKLFHLGIIST
jgi:hypothetical protein